MVKPVLTFFNDDGAFDVDIFRARFTKQQNALGDNQSPRQKRFQRFANTFRNIGSLDSPLSLALAEVITSDSPPIAPTDLFLLDPTLCPEVWEDFCTKMVVEYKNKKPTQEKLAEFIREFFEEWKQTSEPLHIAVLARGYIKQEIALPEDKRSYHNNIPLMHETVKAMQSFCEMFAPLKDTYGFLRDYSLLPPTPNACVDVPRSGNFELSGLYLQFFVMFDLVTIVAEKGVDALHKEAEEKERPTKPSPSALIARLESFAKKKNTLCALDLFLEYHAESNMPLLEAIEVDVIYNKRRGVEKNSKEYLRNNKIPVLERLEILKEAILAYDKIESDAILVNERLDSLKKILLAKNITHDTKLPRKKNSSILLSASPIASEQKKAIGIPSSSDSSPPSSSSSDDLTLTHPTSLATGTWKMLYEDGKKLLAPSSIEEPDEKKSWRDKCKDVLLCWRNDTRRTHGADLIVGQEDENKPFEILTRSAKKDGKWQNTPLQVKDSKNELVLQATLHGLDIHTITFSEKAVETFLGCYTAQEGWQGVYDAFTTFWNKTPQAKAVMHNGEDISKTLCEALQKAIEAKYPQALKAKDSKGKDSGPLKGHP